MESLIMIDFILLMSVWYSFCFFSITCCIC